MGIFFTYEFLNPRVLHVPNIPYAHNIGFPNYGHILFWDFQKSPINEYSVKPPRALQAYSSTLPNMGGILCKQLAADQKSYWIRGQVY
jgi:hypothetical protein